MTTVLAVDLGAESGRVSAVKLSGGRLTQRVVHRFPNRPVMAGGTLYWDLLSLWREVQRGVELGREAAPASVGVDSWAVDFGLLDARGRLLGNPIHYRDHRTDGMLDNLFERVPKHRVFGATGIQFMPINTSLQLLSMSVQKDPQLAAASRLLMIPDLIHHWLCGSLVTEYTNATTTQLYDQTLGTWSPIMIDATGVPVGLLPEVVQPGTVLGDTAGIQVVAPATHDTGSAVAAVPAAGRDFAYISSGTWSLVGLEVEQPYLTPEAVAANVTNEGGVAGTTRLLKNVTGLWILQQCLHRWRAEGMKLDYRTLLRDAAGAPPLSRSVDVDHPDFLYPGDHVALIRRHCLSRGMPEPTSVGEVARAVLESLAFAYRRALESVERVAGRAASVIHVVGGGARNGLLCQFTAEATGRPVIAGPVEATVLGNGGVQLLGLQHLESLEGLREHVRRGTRLKRYNPVAPRGVWQAAYERWLETGDAAQLTTPAAAAAGTATKEGKR